MPKGKVYGNCETIHTRHLKLQEIICISFCGNLIGTHGDGTLILMTQNHGLRPESMFAINSYLAMLHVGFREFQSPGIISKLQDYHISLNRSQCTSSVK